MWRYIDLEGNVQGPFPASQMLNWYEKGHLNMTNLLICGTVSDASFLRFHHPGAEKLIECVSTRAHNVVMHTIIPAELTQLVRAGAEGIASGSAAA